MSFLKGTIPLTVYTASADFFLKVTPERLTHFAFCPIDNVPEEKGWGFVNHDDMFDTEWKKSIPEKGKFIVFGFRIDTRKIPASVYRKHLAAMMAQEFETLEAKGKKFISRERKAEIRELCKAKLLSEQEPQPSMFGVCVDPVDEVIYVASKAKGALETLETYMETAFGERPTPIYPDNGSMAIVNTMVGLLKHGKVVTYNSQQYSVDELGCVTLNDFQKNASVSIENAPENVEAGLQSGLLPSSLKLQITTPEEEEIRFILDARFTISSLKTPRIPKADKDADPDAEFLLKMDYLERTLGVLRSLLVGEGA